MTRGRRLGAVCFTVEFLEPGGVTTPAPVRELHVDAVIDTDPTGRPRIPGTSLAGAVRAQIAGSLGDQRANAWFGLAPEREPGTSRAVASPITVLDAPLTPGGAGPVDRWSTAIDRRRGAARNRTLRGTEVLPAGVSFRAALLWDDPRAGEVDELITGLQGWRPLLGRGVSAGRGRAAVRALRHGVLDLSNQDNLLLWLTTAGHDLAETIATEPAGRRTQVTDEVFVTARLRLTGPVLVAAGRDQDAARTPLRTGDGAPLLPGTSLKGVLRSRVEYILRSLRLPACEEQRCGDCLPCKYFGYGGGDRAEDPAVGRRGSVRVAAARVVGEVHERTTVHVAVDRFTGGAAMRTRTEPKAFGPGARGGLLFTVTAADRGEFTVSLDITDVPPPDRPLLGALLRLALQDLHDGIIGLGWGTTRGYGGVEMVSGDPTGLPSLGEAKAAVRAISAGVS